MTSRWIIAGLCGALLTSAAMAQGDETSRVYSVDYLVELHPPTQSATVTMRVGQPRSLLREVRMTYDSRLSGLEGDGDLVIGASEATWTVPASGGRLRWRVQMPHLRNGSGYDAWLEDDWGIFRAEDIIPRASTRALRGSSSRTSLRFRNPARWSVVTQYFGAENYFHIERAGRRFDQPSGWILAGRIGVRRDTVAGIRVAVAGPVGQSVRRMDTLAMLNWTLPELARLLPEPPRRLTIISAGDPMWRGGLSAPQSVFVHSDRPLISENGTSTLLHEIMHMALGLRSKHNYDWIAEGLAEFYSLELLRRSGTISAVRYSAAHDDLAEWSEDAEALCQPVSSGPATALAVTVFRALDLEIRRRVGGRASLDDVVRSLVDAGRPIGIEELRDQATQVAGTSADALHDSRLPGCSIIQ